MSLKLNPLHPGEFSATTLWADQHITTEHGLWYYDEKETLI